MVDLHTHSEFSHDSVCKIEDMCLAQIARGTKVMAVTDHCDGWFFTERDVFAPIRQSVETVKALDSLLAIPSEAGAHEIEFVYRPNCAVYGGLISVIGILLFALLIVWSRVRRVRALAKCGNDEKKTHFFHYAGDAVGTWTCEMLESEACEDELPEASSEKTESDQAPSESEA